MVEYFYGVWKDKKDKMVFVNFLTDISPNCDCYGFTEPPVTPDIGVLASYDPVSLDQASVDMVNLRAVERIKFQGALYPMRTGTPSCVAAEKIGVGSREYQIT